MFENNLRAKLLVNRAVIIGFLTALDECGERKVQEILQLLRDGVLPGLGPLPKPPKLSEVELPEDERRRMDDRELHRLWTSSFMKIEHCGDLPELADRPEAEYCVKVVNADGSINYAMTEFARLTLVTIFKNATMELVMAKARAR